MQNIFFYDIEKVLHDIKVKYEKIIQTKGPEKFHISVCSDILMQNKAFKPAKYAENTKQEFYQMRFVSKIYLIKCMLYN